jgi:hypothetical protein
MPENTILMITRQEKWSDEVIEQLRRDWDALKQTTFKPLITLEPETTVQLCFLMKDHCNLLVVKSDNLNHEMLDALSRHIRDMDAAGKTLVIGMRNDESFEVMTPEKSVHLFSALAAHLTDEQLDQLGLQRKPA